MQQLSKIPQINVKINLEVNVTDMTKNRLKNKIHHTKNRPRHASNSIKDECITGNK